MEQVNTDCLQQTVEPNETKRERILRRRLLKATIELSLPVTLRCFHFRPVGSVTGWDMRRTNIRHQIR